MEIYLIRHGQIDSGHIDPYTQPLTAKGRAQAKCLAEQCAAWGIGFICASTMRCAEQTADAISERLPDAIRWDLEEMDEVTDNDLMGDPVAGPLVSTWSEQQLALGYEQMNARVMAALVRIQIYADARGIERIAIVGHASTLKALLQDWLDPDRSAAEVPPKAAKRAATDLEVPVDYGATCKVTLDEERTHVEWVNQPSC